MRIPKLSLIFEIDEELTDIFKVKGKAQLPKKLPLLQSKGGVVYNSQLFTHDSQRDLKFEAVKYSGFRLC